ncbi:MAG TPA: exopolysaccharide biosynthesis polyprenyl glycosylphosphotransferase [Nocardioides sp.]|nr:exopolysaccharide biosynthesis polyprenyl glycosylphosphotransferase [Nocardioides sp.]
MVATAPSPATEWSPAGRLPRGLRARPVATRRLPASASPTALLADVLIGLAAAVAVRPFQTGADLALAGVWAVLVAPVGLRAREAAVLGTGGATAGALRAGFALAFAALLLDGLPGVRLEPGRMAAYVVVVVAATAAHHGARTLATSVAAGVDVVVAGHRHGVERMLAELRTAGSRFRVVAVCIAGESPCSGFEVPAVSGLRNLPRAVSEHGAAAVVAVPCRHLDPVRLRRLAWRLEHRGTHMLVGTGLREIGPSRARLGAAGSLPLIHVRHAPLRGARRTVKHLWERLAATLALLVLAPVLLVVAGLIRLDSPGPALFRQTRVGRGGHGFTMLKFRTMVTDAEDRLPALTSDIGADHVLFKVRADPRVTRVGRVLRRYSLDELPQLINVARGEMALVGPRPPLPSEAARYDRDTRRRLAVLPGLTGLWQVSGRSDLSWEESVRLDLRYVENWSLGLDVRIILRTLGAVLGHRGAY